MMSVTRFVSALTAATLLWLAGTAPVQAQPVALSINPDKVVNHIDEKVYGHFLENIYHSCNGGLWGDLIWNRSFEEAGPRYWTVYGPGKILAEANQPLNDQLCERIVAESGETGLQQKPLCIRQGEVYRGSLWARGTAAEGLVVRLLDGAQVLAEATLPAQTAAWQEYPFELRPSRSADHAQLQVGARGKADVCLDQVSMMPDSWAKAGGFRPDLLKAIADLRPPVIRWPGGSFANWYRWKNGIGPQHQRVKHPHPMWDDVDPNSFGTDEFIAMCRRVGTEPLIVVNIGIRDARDQRNQYCQEACDWLEYCNGPADSKWGKVRAANGHPEPYRVKYWELDNEVYRLKVDDYLGVVQQFVPAMRKVDPAIKTVACGSMRLGWDWGNFDIAVIGSTAGLVDSMSVHCYQESHRFADGPAAAEHYWQDLAHMIERSPNPGLKLYVSEWNAMSIDWRAGLYAGCMLNGFERCGDFLEMGGPALFLRHVSAPGTWNNAFINFDHRAWFPAPNYVVMKFWRDHYAPQRIDLTGDAGRLNAIATKSADGKTLYFKAVNPTEQSAAVELTVQSGFRVGGAGMLQVAPDSLDACNSLDKPEVVRPMPAAVEVDGQKIRCNLPRWSAVVVTLKQE